jgi:hypothetical protein
MEQKGTITKRKRKERQMKWCESHLPVEDKWGVTAKALTGALMAHLEAIFTELGPERYRDCIVPIWARIGQDSAQALLAAGRAVDTAKAVAEAGVESCLCAMGPEYRIAPIESAPDRVVMKISHCPWKNRMDEMGITRDLISICDTAFWNHFTQTLNPSIKMCHGRQMHRGDTCCEWIFEPKA